MKVAVVTPYYKEAPDILRQCHESVGAQTHECTHIMLADGYPNPEVDDWPVEHFIFGASHADNGNTPRMVGALSAARRDYDAIAFLDADNWYYPNHIETMVTLHAQTGAAVCSGSVDIYRPDGSLMFKMYENDGEKHVDTSAMFLTREAYSTIGIWGFLPKKLAPVSDRIFWQTIVDRGISRAHEPTVTVAFRTQYKAHYEAMGEEPPTGSKGNEITDSAIDWWENLSPEEREKWARYFLNTVPE